MISGARFRGSRPRTVQYMGWAGLKNGELLGTAETAGFDVFVTGDKRFNSSKTCGIGK
jgi:hypothetical protein